MSAARIFDLIKQVEEQMPFLEPLSSEERALTVSMHGYGQEFVDRTIDFLVANPSEVPEGVDMRKIKANYERGKMLVEVEKKLEALMSSVKDTALKLNGGTFRETIAMYSKNMTGIRMNDCQRTIE